MKKWFHKFTSHFLFRSFDVGKHALVWQYSAIQLDYVDLPRGRKLVTHLLKSTDGDGNMGDVHFSTVVTVELQ